VASQRKPVLVERTDDIGDGDVEKRDAPTVADD